MVPEGSPEPSEARFRMVRRSLTPIPVRYGGVLHDRRIGLRVPRGDPSPSFEVGDESGSELGIVGQPGTIRGKAHRRGEPETLLGFDAGVPVLFDHPLVSAQLAGVLRGPTEALTPPGGDVATVLRVNSTGEE